MLRLITRSSCPLALGPPVKHENVAPPPSAAQEPDTRKRVFHMISETFRHRKPLPSPPSQPPKAPGAKGRNFFKALMVISFGETGGFTKFYLFLSKKRGGVNTCGGAISPRDRSLTAAGGAVYDQGGGGRRGGQSDMVHNGLYIGKRVLFPPFLKGSRGDYAYPFDNPPKSPFKTGGLKKTLNYGFRGNLMSIYTEFINPKPSHKNCLTFGGISSRPGHVLPVIA